MTSPAKAQVSAILAALLLGACASQTGSIAPTGSLGPTASISPSAETVSRLPAAGSYQMTAEEMGHDCRTLTGRMAVRIVQIRDFKQRAQTTGLSRGLQTVAKPAYGGSGEGTDPDARYARDRAMLEAYNHRLAGMNCANFDLEAELNSTAKGPPRTRPLPKT
ncbi:hypothetical protein [Hyphomicrobium sp. CS1GBMeth3]|uniref:hypothetical protein n=1 Tax=Hyphomicrobium sp. CS1GBMeth3 TaxID=1892845 RepID=UPI000931275D|nr:hypothetical protein [Hyphomicrobium sp. CS1GBMeth3]